MNPENPDKKKKDVLVKVAEGQGIHSFTEDEVYGFTGLINYSLKVSVQF